MHGSVENSYKSAISEFRSYGSAAPNVIKSFEIIHFISGDCLISIEAGNRFSQRCQIQHIQAFASALHNQHIQATSPHVSSFPEADDGAGIGRFAIEGPLPKITPYIDHILQAVASLEGEGFNNVKSEISAFFQLLSAKPKSCRP